MNSNDPHRQMRHADAPWRDRFVPRNYLDTYYKVDMPLMNDEKAILEHQVKLLKGKHYTNAIEVGCGPTVHHAIIPVNYVGSLLLTEYLDTNLHEVDTWLKNEAGAYDWDNYVKQALEIEFKREITKRHIEERKSLMRRKIKTALVDLNLEAPLHDHKYDRFFDLLLSYYCADAATGSLEEFARFMRNMFTLVKPGGTFMIATVHDAHSYKVGTVDFPTIHAGSDVIQDILKSCGYDESTLDTELVNVPELGEHGFSTMLIFSGTTLLWN